MSSEKTETDLRVLEAKCVSVRGKSWGPGYKGTLGNEQLTLPHENRPSLTTQHTHSAQHCVRASTGRESSLGKEPIKGELCRRVPLKNAAAHLHHARGDQLCPHTPQHLKYVSNCIIFPTAWVPRPDPPELRLL